jgi:hypothetical protein
VEFVGWWLATEEVCTLGDPPKKEAFGLKLRAATRLFGVVEIIDIYSLLPPSVVIVSEISATFLVCFKPSFPFALTLGCIIMEAFYSIKTVTW